ncbi:MAG TPA: glutamate--cysteine ligase, partial [Coxiellaceae bacterium]|nr:glutamate--cysteine ligase [Coxiellaceae bacterium]
MFSVPHLETALTGPLLALEKKILGAQVQIESWFRSQWQATPPPFYGSVDLRNAGFKLAPVDTNLFPAGFNNLNPEMMALCVQAVQATMAEKCACATRLLLIPESHTRNIFYFENLAMLSEIFSRAGFDVRMGSINPDITSPHTQILPSGREIILEPL